MKKYLMILFAVVAVNVAFAQSTTWSWSQYSVSFTLPNSLGIDTNTGDEFVASDDYMEFGIYPFNDADVSTDDIGAYTEAIAYMLDLEGVDGASDFDLNGFEGAIAEGTSNGMRVAVVGLIDPDGATNFYATVTFEDGDEESLNMAVAILRSISKK